MIVLVLGLFITSFLQAEEIIADGIVYNKITHQDPNLVIHIVTIDPTKAKIVVETAHSKCNSAEKVSQIAKRTGALVAINGGFFDFGQKTEWRDKLVKFFDLLGYNRSSAFPIFALKIKQHWFSLSHKKAGILGWQANMQNAFMDVLQNKWQLKVGDTLLPVIDINKPYAPGPIIYTPAYDAVTQKDYGITEVIVEDNTIVAIKSGNGGNKIPHNGFVYAIKNSDKINTDFLAVKVGEQAIIEQLYSNSDHDWHHTDYLLASTPLMIRDGKITDTIKQGTSAFYTHRHPRTAVGILQDGSWVFVVVDGRQAHSVGMTLRELALLMKNLGCVSALNLDGGGSSTMVIDNKIVNSPSGREYSLFKGERKLSNALLVFSDTITT